jgi:hypothetical protein
LFIMVMEVFTNMKLLRSTTILLMVFGLALVMSACSGGNSPVAPTGQDMPASFGLSTDEGRNIIAAYEVTIDPVAETVTMEPVSRENAFHYKLGTWNLAGQGGFAVLSMVGYHFGPFWADFKLTHPFPASSIKGYDPRVIAILPANTGVSFNYPTFNVQGNNAIVLEPDGYTPLFDSAGGSIAGNVNPFKAYFKSQPFRVWAGANPTETQRWNMLLAGFAGPATFLMVCDVSTNYPAAPAPVVDNAKEPVQMAVTVGTGLVPTGGSANVDVTILDWQGYTGSTVEVEVPALFTGKVSLAYNAPGGADLYIFRGTISNTLLAPIGDYTGIACGKDTASGIAMYVEFTATVSEGGGPGNWTMDPARGNVDMSGFLLPPKVGSDIAVVDSGLPDYDGALFFAAGENQFVVKTDLALTDADYYGPCFYPWDDDPSNPHPTPDATMPFVRIDGANNGGVFCTLDDPHQGLEDQYSNFQRNDDIVIMFMSDGVELQVLTGIYLAITDDPDTTDFDESLERPCGWDVWDESPDSNMFNLGILWRGTVHMDDTNTWYDMGWMGGFAQPYFDGSAFIQDWGLWRVTGPAFDQMVAGDASMDPLFLNHYYAYSFGAVVAWGKDFVFQDVYYTQDETAAVLDMELIPLQNPPLNIDGKIQTTDWVAILNNNKTVEIYDPFVTGGELVDMVDISGITGDAYYMDIADNSAEIWISHSDGTIPYCSVYTLD